MAMTPVYKFPAKPSHLSFAEGAGSSFSQHTVGINYGTGRDVWYQIGDASTIDVSDFDITTHTSLQTAYRKTLCKFKNNLEFKIRMYYEAGQRWVQARLEVWYGQTEVGNIPGVTIPYLAWRYDNDNHLNILFDNPMYMTLSTAYNTAEPIENLTEADKLNIMVWLDCDAFVGPDLARETTNVGNFLTGMRTFQLKDVQTVIHDGEPYRIDPIISNIIEITDLTAFNTWMKTAGDGMNEDIYDNDPTDPEEDPSGPGGGGGHYDPSSDPIDFPDLPTGGALTSGMIKGFLVSSQTLIALQAKLWNMSIFDITTQFQKLVNQPLDCLISLHCLPVLPTTGSSSDIKLGSFDTELDSLLIANQYVEVNCGTLNVPLYWGSALDYAPFSRAEIFVPFVGFRNIQIEDIQGLTLQLKYHVDVLTGDCVAYLKCGNSVLYSWTGNCLSHIPCTSSSSDLLAKSISAVGAIGVGMATGNPASAAAGVISGATNVVTSKNHVQRSGDVAGSPGVMSEFVPYIIYHRPKQSLASGYNRYKGYPSNITSILGDLTGYTEVEHIHLTGISGATDTEMREIEELLKGGVII